eukprot:TRINITY_DN70160_c0_g1_i1.p1 TRINITY_DN70160_c0_g1~~TRINITY_DN70160_c0_g1_i1.p1  ORF type:complete len:242 (-),score=45.54 TRINITY_DN70160_c0_g1_i1:31-756(-)
METTPLKPTHEAEFVKNAEKDVRLGFVRKVYGILAAQLFATVVIAAPIYILGDDWALRQQWILLFSLLVLMASMCSTICCEPMVKIFPNNCIILFLLTAAVSILVGFSSAMYTWQAIHFCAGLAAAIFFELTIYAACTKTDFVGVRPYLVAALLTCSSFGFAVYTMGSYGVDLQSNLMLHDFAGVLIFTMLMVYDTQLVLGEHGGHRVRFHIDEHCYAALTLSLDIANVCVHLICFFGDRK